MVLQPAGSRVRLSAPAPERPDPVRIIGLTGTLVFNAVLLMLLLIPARAVLETAPAEYRQEFHWITPPAEPPPPPPAEVVQAPVEPRTPVVQPVAQALPIPLLEPVLSFETGTLPAPPVTAPPSPGPAAGAVDSTPQQGLALQYAQAPAPAYPRAALLAGAEGVVLLEVHVAADGRPLEVNIHRSSGNRDLDRAAQRQVQQRWRFQPAMRDGVAIEAIGLVPIAFNLGDR